MARLEYLLDTNVLSEPMRLRPNERLLSRLERFSEQSATSATVWHELRFGCQRLTMSRRRRELEAYLEALSGSRFPILAYDRQAANIHAILRAKLESRGLGAGQADGEIAAVALTHGLTLVTANTRHFEIFPDLRLEDWSLSPT